MPIRVFISMTPITLFLDPL